MGARAWDEFAPRNPRDPTEGGEVRSKFTNVAWEKRNTKEGEKNGLGGKATPTNRKER